MELLVHRAASHRGRFVVFELEPELADLQQQPPLQKRKVTACLLPGRAEAKTRLSRPHFFLETRVRPQGEASWRASFLVAPSRRHPGARPGSWLAASLPICSLLLSLPLLKNFAATTSSRAASKRRLHSRRAAAERNSRTRNKVCPLVRLDNKQPRLLAAHDRRWTTCDACPRPRARELRHATRVSRPTRESSPANSCFCCSCPNNNLQVMPLALELRTSNQQLCSSLANWKARRTVQSTTGQFMGSKLPLKLQNAARLVRTGRVASTRIRPGPFRSRCTTREFKR